MAFCTKLKTLVKIIESYRQNLKVLKVADYEFVVIFLIKILKIMYADLYENWYSRFFEVADYESGVIFEI